MIAWPPSRGGVAKMVATLGPAVGMADRRRICTWFGGNVIAGPEDGGDRPMRRHIVTICQTELFTFLADAAECRRSSAVDKSQGGDARCKRFENKFILSWDGT